MVDEKFKNWFVHDMIGKLCTIKNYIEGSMENIPKSSSTRALKKANIHLHEAFYLVDILSSGEFPKSVYKNIELWSQWKNYPKVKINLIEDFEIKKGNSIYTLIGIVSEMKQNASKAKANLLTITINKDEILFENDGQPIENPENIFEKNYSEFGTSGIGLNLILEMSKQINAEFSLESIKPVIFKLKFS